MTDVLTIENVLALSWEALRNGPILGLFTILFMQVMGKNIVELSRMLVLKYILKKEVEPVIDGSDDWSLRGLLFNLVAYAFAQMISSLHLSDTFTGGDSFVVAIVATVVAISGYEVVKNLLKTVGVRLITTGYKWH